MEIIKKTVGLSKDNTKIENLINIMMFLNMVIIGGDRLSFKLSGMTIRLAQITLFITFVLMWKERKVFFEKKRIFIPFLVANIISTIFSSYFQTGIIYIVWTIYNYIFVFSLFYSWCKDKSKEWVIDFWMGTFIIQGVYVIFQYVIGLNKINDMFFPMQVHLNVFRPAIWFYEPSYLATYFSIYLSMAFYLYISTGKNKYFINLLFCFFCLLIISSSLGYMSIALVFCSGILLNIIISKKINIRRILTSLGSFLCIFFILNLVDSNLFDVFGGRLFNSQPQSIEEADKNSVINKLENSSLGAASGGRVTAWKATIDVFEESPIIGIGPNAYPQYTGTGGPPSNVTLEILANLGVIGLITFLIFILGIIGISIKSIKRNDFIAISLIFSIIIFAILLQANQNYLRLYMWMHLGIIPALCRREDTVL